ncbi:MAG TPA: DUF2231 domain-containing protein [Tepidisphaeraceae bacterium]|nr:DUF2231 domain-containing protein [Tepidisphaeraceae bacterium]
MLGSIFPPIPGLDSLHPLVIHFPIALLLVSPLFLLLALALPKRGQAFGIAALILMALGTLGIVVAIWTGERAGELAERTPQVNAMLEEHEELADATRTTFLVLTLLYAAILVAATYLPPLQRPRVRLPIHATFLLLFLAGGVLLANTAHRGGRLVHQFGIHALMAEPLPTNLATEH